MTATAQTTAGTTTDRVRTSPRPDMPTYARLDLALLHFARQRHHLQSAQGVQSNAKGAA